MKKIIFVILFLVPLFSSAQHARIADGVFDVHVGSSLNDAIETLSKKGIKLDENNSTRAVYIFTGIDQGKWKNVTLYLKVRFDKVYEITLAYIYGLLPENILQNYNALIKELNLSYGPGKSSKVFDKPFFDGDGHELEAIGSRRGTYFTTWTNPDKSTLVLSIFPTYTMLLTYHGPQL